MLAKSRGLEPFKMYLLGLVHDTGKIAIFSELCKQFQKNGETTSPGYNAFVPLMMVLSPAVSYWIAKDWELPEEICNVLAEQIGLSKGAEVSAAANLLFQANMVTEVSETLLHTHPKVAEQVLSTFALPDDLFLKLCLLYTSPSPRDRG